MLSSTQNKASETKASKSSSNFSSLTSIGCRLRLTNTSESFGKVFSSVSTFRSIFIVDVVFWHADKSQYQRETSIKIASIMGNLTGSTDDEVSERKRAWFEASLYILNKHWHKVDNFRIDKFLALLRHMFS